jgi:hypothetical protein
MFACCHFYFRLQLPLIIIHITCIPLSLRRTSAPIHLKSVLGVLGTQETSCILIVGLLERDIFDLYLPEFDKPWVIHLRETCCCYTNLCTWRPNTVYKNRSMHRHHAASLDTEKTDSRGVSTTAAPPFRRSMALATSTMGREDSPPRASAHPFHSASTPLLSSCSCRPLSSRGPARSMGSSQRQARSQGIRTWRSRSVVIGVVL